jgi:hypothetical protein
LDASHHWIEIDPEPEKDSSAVTVHVVAEIETCKSADAWKSKAVGMHAKEKLSGTVMEDPAAICKIEGRLEG